jgi:hypothetical protein
VKCNICLYLGTYTSGVEPFLLSHSVFVPLHSVMWSGVERTYTYVCVCVDSASAALGLSHDGLSSHRAVLPAPLGTAVNKG